ALAAYAAPIEWSQEELENTPPARRSHAMAYDPVNKVVIVFGGYGNGSHLADTWALDLKNKAWINMTSPNSPSARAATAMIHDPVNKRMVLFGGFAQGHSIVSNDTWGYSYPTNSWTELRPDDAPSERASYGMAYDSTRHEIVLFGGFTERGYFNDMWIYNIEENAWRELSTSGEVPSPRGAMGFVYDIRNDVFIMFGGFSDRGFFSDTWVFEPQSGAWDRKEPSDSPPPIRTRMVYDNSTGRAIFFGGDTISPESEEGAPEPYSEVWAYDFAANLWTSIETSNAPPARALNGIIYEPESRALLIFGGTDTLIDEENFVGHEFQDTWILASRENGSAANESQGMPIAIPVGIGAAIAIAIAAAVALWKKKSSGKA
ncbi:MAG: Kelch repeat-containing protein, partial [Nitrososphaera sp.]